jgi:hypothetical protein
MTDRPDETYEAPLLRQSEDRAYAIASPFDVVNHPVVRRFRRRQLQTTVDFRSL